MQFRYYMPTEIRFEKDAALHAGEYIQAEKVLLVCDPFFATNGLAGKVAGAMEGKQVAIFSDIAPNPSCSSVDAAAEAARALGAGCVVGLGGGSSLDVAKIVACLATQPGSIYDYFAGGTRTLTAREAGLVCIPTTAGTGSEVTNVGVYTDTKSGRKMPLVADAFWADTALLDPALTYTLPASVTAASGMDAFCHAVEAYWNKNSQPLCDAPAMAAMKLVLENIETACKAPGDEQARANMLLASLLAGVAFSQTRTTGIHALSFPLTVDFGLSHGAACAITLPAFLRASIQGAAPKMNALARYLGYGETAALADAVEALMERVGLPTRLSQAGVCAQDISRLAEIGLGQAIIQLTPAEMNQETVQALLESIL